MNDTPGASSESRPDDRILFDELRRLVKQAHTALQTAQDVEQAFNKRVRLTRSLTNASRAVQRTMDELNLMARRR
jgi:hypothetical protein